MISPHLLLQLVRETAIQCLVALSELPHARIYPMRTQVCHAFSLKGWILLAFDKYSYWSSYHDLNRMLFYLIHILSCVQCLNQLVHRYWVWRWSLFLYFHFFWNLGVKCLFVTISYLIILGSTSNIKVSWRFKESCSPWSCQMSANMVGTFFWNYVQYHLVR